MPRINEQELLGMPTSDYMNEKQLSFFQQYLLNLKSDLLMELGWSLKKGDWQWLTRSWP
ncbi:hypothetical protein ACJJIP_10525 [Microbulbifer sp. VTAC004]|uniref:hypothetical protein n=1 Tax=Microbulbifer sp. VTAC004 TaxID=3243386 RepID=UPI00403A4A6C